MTLTRSIQVLFCSIAMSLSVAYAQTSPQSQWRFVAGISAGDPTPIMLNTGFGYKSVILYLEGLGVHNGANDFWCGARGSIDWTFFRDLPFSIDVGLSSGYEYAEAPNEKHKALNKANDGIIVLPYNYQESLDFSFDFKVHLYGFFTQINYPIVLFLEHDTPKLFWRIGYLIHF